MMDYHASIIGTLFSLVDKYSGDFVAHTYHELVATYSEVIYSVVVLYVGLVFINIKRGTLSFADLPFVLIKAVTVLTIAMNYDYFFLYLYNVFTNGPLEMCKAITLDDKGVSTTTITNALDNFIKEGCREANKLFSMGGWTNLLFSVFGVFVFLATMMAGAIAAGLVFLSKIASSVLLAFSPFFIVLALFDSTKGWFDSYIQHLFSYALVPIVACGVMMITLSVTESTIEYMGSGAPSFSLLLPFMVACVIQIWLFLQVPQKCASLSSGFNLKSFTASMRETKSAVASAMTMLTGGKLGRPVVGAAWGALNKGGGVLSGFIQNRARRYKDNDKP